MNHHYIPTDSDHIPTAPHWSRPHFARLLEGLEGEQTEKEIRSLAALVPQMSGSPMLDEEDRVRCLRFQCFTENR